MGMRLLCVVLALLASLTIGLNRPSTTPKGPANGYVPDATTATKIAEPVLIPVYGEKQIASERPFHATLKDEVWTVETTSPCEAAQEARAGTVCYGGGAVVKLSKTDARILFMMHYK